MTLLAHAQDAPPAEGEAVAVSQSLRSRRAIAHAAQYLTSLTETGIQGWAVQPGYKPEYETVVVKYRIETITVKRPVYEYTTVEVMKVIGSGSNRRMVKTTERRVAGIKEYVDVEDHRWVRDPNGDRDRSVRVAKKDSANLAGGVTIVPGFLGYNAKVLYLLMALGYEASDPTVQRLEAALETYILSFGLPDHTYDVAWLLAAFANYPERNDTLDQIRLALLRKLLGGQVNDARLPGMWGVICLDHEVASAQMKLLLSAFEEKTAINQEIAAAKKRGRERDVEKAQARLTSLEKDMEKLGEKARLVSWRSAFLVTPDYRREVVLEPPHEGGGRSANFHDQLYPLRLPPPQIDMLAEALTDLESTRWALFGLAEAKANGFLPRSIEREDVGRQRFAPLETEKALQRAFNAIVTCYRKDKGWIPGMQHVPLKKRYYGDFEQVRDLPEMRLENEVSPAADADAFHAMQSLDRAMGLEDLSDDSAAIAATLEKVVGDYLTLVNYFNNSAALKKNPTRARNAFSYIDALAAFRWSLTGRELVRAGAGEELANYLLTRQLPNGAWGNAQTSVFVLPYSVHELATARYEAHLKTLKEGDKKPRAPTWHPYKVNGSATITADALEFLAASVWPAAAVHWRGAGLKASPMVLPRGLRYLNEAGMQLSFVSAESWPPPEMEDSPACVVLTGDGPLTPEQAAALSPLFPYVEAGGVLVVEAKADDQGIAFCNSIFEALGPAIADKSFTDMPADSVLIAGMKEPPKMRAVLRGDGSVAAVFLMLADKTSGYAMSRSTAGKVLETILRNRLAPTLLQPSYLVVDDFGSSFDLPDPGEEAADGDTGDQ